MTDPARVKKWLIWAALAYLLFPRDLVPDFLGRGLGYVEDLILIGLAIVYFRAYQRRHAARASGRQEERPPQQGPNDAAKAFDPYGVLGVERSADRADIRAAYRARMSEYHPDKVAHLGEDLQKLAHDKALEIQEAYRQLADG